MSQPPPPQIPGTEAKKKGMPTLAWVGIGCGGIILIGIVCVVIAVGWGVKKAKEFTANPGKAAAEMMVVANKDLEKVADNDATGEMTIRVKSTGEQVTLKYDDLAKGRFTVKDKDGNVSQFGQGDLDKVLSWVPRYVGATDEASVMQSEDSRETSGILTFTTSDSTDEIGKFYEDEAAKISLTSSNRSSMNLNGNDTLSMEFKGGKCNLTVTVFGKSGSPLNVQVVYSEKK